jgi:hypothetical protein
MVYYIVYLKFNLFYVTSEVPLVGGSELTET